MFIDSHCHLAGEEFAADLDTVVDRARGAGLERALVILPAHEREELARASAVTGAWPPVRYSIGVHPHSAGVFAASPASVVDVVGAALDAQLLARAVGEIGLDYHYDFAPRDIQQQVFRAQIRVARERNLPIVIHTREAEDDTFRLLAEQPSSRGVFHCFTGDRAMARRALDAGFVLSLAGIVSFPKAEELREVARFVPLDRLLIETDSPFLAPVPFRGKRNEPAHVVRVAETIAVARGIGVDRVAEATTHNFNALFAP